MRAVTPVGPPEITDEIRAAYTAVVKARRDLAQALHVFDCVTDRDVIGLDELPHNLTVEEALSRCTLYPFS